MRSMSMLQLLGGVAAAGVVAAGTTAFTAQGTTASNAAVIGGKVDVSTFSALTVNSVQATWNPTNGKFTGFKVAFAAIADGSTVNVSIADGGTNDAAVFSCTTASNVATCTTPEFTAGTFTHIYITA